MDFERGDTTTKLKVLGKVGAKETRHEGLVQARHEIFTELRLSTTTRSPTRLRELAFLNKGVTITLTDEREGQEKDETFHAKGGLGSSSSTSTRSRKPLHPEVIYVETDEGRHRHRARAAVQRRLQRERLLLRQQHQHARRRHAPHRLQGGADAHDQQLRAQGQLPQEGRLHALAATTCAKD